jgi:sigma-B regulation protein RsbU (phosphoserine phosphatase)
MAIDAAAIPPDVERERLRAVEQVSVVGTEPEERFDQIIRVAKMMFGVPMSSISLIDDRHQWFKSVDGLAATPIPREETVCQVTIARAYKETANPIYVVEDAADISDFACLPGVGGEGEVRFYAGHPLYGPGGHPVGVFCIYDSQPRTLGNDELKAFSELATWVQHEMERSAEVGRAAQVQRDLLPREIGEIPGYETGAVCLPASSVGGDFYDHYVTGTGAYFSLVDVMGKGMAAAILTATVRSALRGSTRALADVPHTDLGTVVGVVSEQLADDFTRTASFATAFHARLDPTDHSLTYVDAGHGLAFLRRPDGTTEHLATTDLPLGVGSDWEAVTTTLDPGVMLVVCSDGLLDIVSDDSVSDDLARLISRYETPSRLITAVQTWVRDTISVDDVTVIALRRSER